MSSGTRIFSSFRAVITADDNTRRVYYPVAPDMAYIKDINYHDVRTEGMSYGMMIAVQLNKKSEFDRLWKWAKTYMQHQSGANKDYFAWHCKTDGSILSENSASDGEEWFVMALVFASARWGDGEGIFAYKDEAPALSGWAYEKFGGFNSKFYEHVFELILRLKRNFLWPAM